MWIRMKYVYIYSLSLCISPSLETHANPNVPFTVRVTININQPVHETAAPSWNANPRARVFS